MISIRPLGVVSPLLGRSADSLLILSTSFERRCLGFVQQAVNQRSLYRTERTVVVKYSDREDRLVRHRVKQYSSALRSCASTVTLGNRIDDAFLDPFEVAGAYDLFLDCFQSIEHESTVTVDISTLSKLHLFYLLEAARNSRRVSLLRLVYTRARYGRYDTLSWGAEEPMILPMFGRPPLPGQDRTNLVLLCGLEPDRAYSVWRRFGQDRCVQMFVDSGDDDPDRCASRARSLNSFDPSSEQLVVQAFAPDEIERLLRQAYASAAESGGYLYIAPLASKWEVVGTWSFFRTAGEEALAAVVYSAPGRLNVAGHTLDDLGELIGAEISDL